MIRGFLLGLSCLKDGFSLIRQKGIKRFVMVPLLVNVLVFVGLGWLASDAFSGFLASQSWLNPDPETWLGQILDKVMILVWLLFGIAILIVFTYTFTLVANLIASPFNSLLAEKVEAHLRGTLDPNSGDSISHLITSLPKVLRSEAGKIIYLLLWMIPLLILYVIPGVNILAPFVSFLFGAWMFGLEYIDYPMGNNGFFFGQIKQRLRKNRQTALGFGSAVTVLTAIPLINLVAMPVAVAGATKLWVDELSNQETITES